MAIRSNLKEPVVLLLLIVVSTVLSGELMQLLETLKEDATNSEESNKFVRTVLEHKNDLEWIENLGHQYRGIRDTLQTDEDLVDCSWNPLNSDQYARRSDNYKYKFRQNNNRYAPYALSPYSSGDYYGRDKRQSLWYANRPHIQVRNNGLSGVLRPYSLKHVPHKRKSDNVNDAEEQRVINIDHEKELQKLEAKPREEDHDILGLKDYSQKDEILEENQEYLKTSTAISENQRKTKRYGNTFDSNENILLSKPNRMLRKSTDFYNRNPNCDDGKCANNDQMTIRDNDIPGRNTNDANREIVQAVFDPECTSCSPDNTNQFQIMLLPEPVATPIRMKSPMRTRLDLNEDTPKIIQKKAVPVNHSSLIEVPFVTNPPVDIIHSKNYHNFVPEKDIYIDPNKFSANTEANIFKDILETEKYVPEYGPLHIARIQPATAEPAHVFSFEHSSQRSLLNEMTAEEKRKAAVEAHKLMEVDKEFNERNEPEVETKDDSKGNAQNTDVNFKSRSLKYIDMDKEEGQYSPYVDYANNYRHVNRHAKRSNAKEVIQSGLKKLKKIFGFGNDKIDYEEVTDAYPFDERQSNVINDDFDDYEFIPRHRDKTVHRKYHRKKEGDGDHRYVHKSSRFSHQNRKHPVDTRKKYKADECAETTPKTTTPACVTTSTTPTTTTTTTTTTPTTCTTPTTTTPSTTTTTQTTTACAPPSTTTPSCTNSPAEINNMEAIDEKADDYLADENEEEACRETTTEHIQFGPTANVSCESTPNKKNEEAQIKNSEDLINVTGAGESTTASASTEGTSVVTSTEVSSITTIATGSETATTARSGESTSEISGAGGTVVSEVAGTTEAASTTSSEVTSATGSETTSATGSEATSTAGSEVTSGTGTTSTIVSESAGPTGSEATSTAGSEATGTTASEVTTIAFSEISELATTHPETSSGSEESTTSHEHTTPNIMSTEHTNTSEPTTHHAATTLGNGEPITEHEHKSNRTVVEDFPQDQTMDEKLHGTTAGSAHTTSHEGNESEENATECTETADDTKRKRKTSVHEAADAKRNAHQSENGSKTHSKRSNSKHLQKKESTISLPRISKKHHKKNNKVTIRHRKRALDTESKQNNDENEDMNQETSRTSPVLTSYNNKEDEDMMENNGKRESKRTINNFRHRTNRYAPNKFSFNRHIPRNRRHHFEQHDTNHPKVRTRRSNHMLPASRYSSSQAQIISQETAQDVEEEDDLNYLEPVEFEGELFKNPFATDQLSENINYNDIKNGVSAQTNTQYDDAESMHLSKRNYDANLRENSAENVNRRNRMDVNNGGKNEHSTNAPDTSHNDGSIDTHLKDEALKGQLAAQIVESIFNEVESSGQLKKHIGPGLDKSHKTRPVTNQGKSDKHQNEAEAHQLENMQQNIMQSLNKLIDEAIQRQACVPLDPESAVFLEQLTNKQNNLAKSYETELDQRATDRPPHQETFLFEEPQKAKGSNNTHHGTIAIPGVQKTPDVHTKQTAQNGHGNEPQAGRGNHNERPSQSKAIGQQGLVTELNIPIGVNTEHGHVTGNGKHTALCTVAHNAEHISHEGTTHAASLQSPVSQKEFNEKPESTTCSEDAKIDIFAPEHVSAFHSESPHAGSTEQGLGMEHGLATEHGLSTEIGVSTEQGLATEHGLSTEGLATEQGLPTENGLSTEQGLATEHGLSTEQGLPTEHGLSTVIGLSIEQGLATEQGLSTEHELATEHGLSTEHELSTAHELLTEHRLVEEREISAERGLLTQRELSAEHLVLKQRELSTESTTANTDTKEMEDKKEGVKRLMTMYNELPQNDRHKFCNVYQYLHKQNIFLDRVIRQVKHSSRSARYSQEYFDSRRRRYPYYEYEYVPRQYYKPRHQIWSQQYVSNAEQTPSDKYMKLVKRAMYYRRKREAEERLRKQTEMNTTGKSEKLPTVTTEGMEDLTFNYSNT